MGCLGSGKRVVVVVCLAGLAGLGVGSGCDPGGGKPPVGLKVTTTSESAVESKTLFLVLPASPEGGDLQAWSLVAQREAGLLNVIFRITGPAPGKPSSQQDESIRKSVREGAEALLVVPADGPDIAAALAEVAAKGVAVVLIGREVASPAGKPPYPTIVPAPFGPTARQIVDSALADAKKNGRPVDGIALILSDKSADPFAGDRSAALKAAAKAAGVRDTVDVAFDGDPAEATRLVVEAVKAHPDIVVVLANDDPGMLGSIQARRDLKASPLVFIGGYVGLRGEVPAMAFAGESAFVEFRVDQMARMGVKAAVDRALGKPVPAIIELVSKFNRGSANIRFDNPIQRRDPMAPPNLGEDAPKVAPR